MYPIRTNRPLWSKSFMKTHVCSSMCNAEYELIDQNFRFTYQTTCLYPENLEPIQLPISENIRTDTNQEQFIDDIIPIPKKVFISIHYPLTTAILREHEFDQMPITTSQILKVFDQIYKNIYQEEEEKSSTKTFLIEYECQDCDEKTYLPEYIDNFLTQIEDGSQCNICFDEDSSEDVGGIVQINRCSHIYHKKCILKWYNTPKTLTNGDQETFSNSCPHCRQSIIYCQTCDGTHIIKEEFTGKVPPYRSGAERVETDGPYGIHSIYYEDLYFKGIMYNSKTNTLSLLSA